MGSPLVRCHWIKRKHLVPQQNGLAVVEAITLVDYSHIIASATLDCDLGPASIPSRPRRLKGPGSSGFVEE